MEKITFEKGDLVEIKEEYLGSVAITTSLAHKFPGPYRVERVDDIPVNAQKAYRHHQALVLSKDGRNIAPEFMLQRFSGVFFKKVSLN
ncbi:hypothetical protein C0584_05300 [Candidatus Parcubacteria bacterium]|nr:MAG: hypothetical protein C0584_05300 [Candidatus Parcubacteria bacterium]